MFMDLVKNNTETCEMFFNRGYAYYDKKQYDEAIKDYTEAIRLDPNYAWAYNNRGNVYYSKKDYDRAIADYDEALRVDPSFTIAQTRRVEAIKAKKP